MICDIAVGQLLYNSTLMKEMLAAASKLILLGKLIGKKLLSFQYLPLKV